MKKIGFKKFIGILLRDLLLAFVLTVIVAVLVGYSGFIVVGWSSMPDIPIYSLVIEYKNTPFEDLKVGDFITFSYGTGYTTHQIIAICEDGYFQNGEEIIAIVEGQEVAFEFNSEKTNVNIITRQKNKEVSAENSDYLNYEKNFVGKVLVVMPILGQIAYYIQRNYIQVIVAVGMAFCIYFIFQKEDEYIRLF